MSSTTEVTSSAHDLLAASERLQASVAARDARELDLRDAVHAVSRALGEIAAMSESLCRDFSLAGMRLEPPVSSELVRRGQELTASLCAARRNAELVCRHLPAPAGAQAPTAALAAHGR